jgi:hypothetical protein
MGTSLLSLLLVLVSSPESVLSSVKSNPSGFLFWGEVLLAPNGLGFFGRPLGGLILYLLYILHSNLHKMGDMGIKIWMAWITYITKTYITITYITKTYITCELLSIKIG